MAACYLKNLERLTIPPSKEVKLLGLWVSSFVWRVEWALKLKGVDYEYIEEDIYNKSPLLLELNPVHKKVPVLVHDGKVILESFVILEYIDETWKDYPLLPQDPYEKAMAHFWAKFAEEKFLVAACIAMCSDGEDKEKFVKLSMEALEKIEGELKLKGNKFFGGETIGYLDLAIGWIPHWLPVWEEVGAMKIVDPLKFPATILWMNNFLNHPVIKDNLPPRDKMLVYFQKRNKESEIVAIVAALIAASRKG
ncbi:glutathione transferase GST 23-like [Cornus florida]|uniref:glutathione transferase GST 23-like n=1 Tax=Cornus florida TaxID=4283 RepID=UPI0028A0A002|nr:glutathione transferase GST 23-like [Cornus florida]